MGGPYSGFFHPFAFEDKLKPKNANFEVKYPRRVFAMFFHDKSSNKSVAPCGAFSF
ncbi:hypothetical protein HBZC1_17840 [Helicobacter bizzozeronii CIII-1]|uniref:Uncharacterized protein n=1 Tax=Helicobacter bizzozeronii (strain CIII-1) TaxID=1002804 RepID=F8KPN9_HELBC|nr:hypothetical protein HBZC1_17840 [Helicobacter bizzozeronii CIII-1]